MVSSGRQAIACILLILGIAIYSQAQTTPAKQPTASISGKVTLKGKGVPGIVVMATDYNYRGLGDRARFRATTDESGKYRISNVPEGSYQISPYARAFAFENEQVFNPVNVAEGETIEDLNFVLLRGGVITGRVTDADGQPLIEQPISLTAIANQNVISSHGSIYTDDRGIYRAFGLRPGNYKVSAGSEGHRLAVPGRSLQSYGQTFYPSTSDEAKATVIEVSEGSETKDIDIVLATRGPAGFKVTGQIIDGATGKPLPNITYGVSHHYDGGSTTTTTGARSNVDGEFRFENLLPGKYSVYIQPEPNTEIRANPVPFEVTDSDLAGLVVKTVKGATLSGVVVIEGMDEKLFSKKLTELHVSAHVSTPGANTVVPGMHDMYDMHGSVAMVLKPDGTFKLSGLRGGTAHISVSSIGRVNSQDMALVRVERDGIVQPSGITIKAGEHVQGLRLVVRQLTGEIRGQVKIEGGELPRSTSMMVNFALIDETPHRSYRSEQVDARGRFFIHGLAAGRYELILYAFGTGVRHSPNDMKQEVSDADNTVSEVVLTLKLKNDP